MLRISVDDLLSTRVGAVYCDGVRPHKCIGFDTEEGWARCYVTDDAGSVVQDGHGTLLTVERRGHITFEWADFRSRGVME